MAGDNSWNNAPLLMQIAASQQGGTRGAQVWGLTDQYALVSTFQESPGGNWSSWSAPGWANAPGTMQQVAVCQQNDGRCQLWATDVDQQVWSIWQTAPGGDWSTWSGPNWNNAPTTFNVLAACQQGGTRGAQVWGIDNDKVLWTAFQITPGGGWSAWAKWDGAPLASDVAAAQQNNGCCQLWVVDAKTQLWSATQTAPGGGWTGFSGPNWNSAPGLQSIAASQQGGSRGAQFWGIDGINNLWSTFQESPGGGWSKWMGPNWFGAKSPFMQVAVCQQNNGCVELWGIDMNQAVKTTWQTSPGGGWVGWQP